MARLRTSTVLLTWDGIAALQKHRARIEAAEAVGHTFSTEDREMAIEGLTIIRCTRCKQNVGLQPTPSPKTCRGPEL